MDKVNEYNPTKEKRSVIKKEDVILDVENIENTNAAKEEIVAPKKTETKAEDIEDFEKNDVLIVKQVIEPLIISTKDGSIIRSGTVMLEKIEIQEEEK